MGRLYRLLKKLVGAPVPKSFEEKIKLARQRGIAIGNNCHIYSDLPANRDCFLLTIGNNVTISTGVIFLLHDAAIGTATGGRYTDLLGKIIVGDDSFIGCGAIILPGVTIPPRTIVAAGAVLVKSPPITRGGVVVGGNPARVIETVDDYIKKAPEKGFNLNGVDQKKLEKLVSNSSGMLIERKQMR